MSNTTTSISGHYDGVPFPQHIGIKPDPSSVHILRAGGDFVGEAVYRHPRELGLAHLAPGDVVGYRCWIRLCIFDFTSREEFTDRSSITVGFVDAHPDTAVISDNLTLLRSALNNRLNFE